MEFIPCRKCANSDTPGYRVIEHRDPGTGIYYRYLKKCECYAKYQAMKMKAAWASRANIRPSLYEMDPPYHPSTDYIGQRSKENVEKVIRYGEDPTTFKHQSLYLYGPNGTQKTTLAQWIGLARIEKGQKPFYTLMRSLTNALVEAQYIRNDEPTQVTFERRAYLDNVRNCDLLILDESFDTSKVTIYKSQYQIPFLDEFLRERIDIQQRPVVFVSNVSVDRIPVDTFGMSMTNLLKREIERKGASLQFLDVYQDEVNDFSIQDIFA